MRCEPMLHSFTQPTFAPIVIALLACVTCQGCAFRATTPQPSPHSPLLTGSTHAHLEAQHHRAQFLNTSHASPAPKRATKRKSRHTPPTSATVTARVEERRATRREASLPSLSILKKESVEPSDARGGSGEQALLAKLDAHLASAKSPLHDPKSPIGSLAELHQRCKKLGRIDFKHVSANAIVFFHNTHDANEDGRNNDWYTFAAIARSGPDTTQRVELVNPSKPGDEPIHLSIAYPDMYTTEGGIVLNSHIRQPEKNDLPYTRYLAGELFAGSCRVGRE